LTIFLLKLFYHAINPYFSFHLIDTWHTRIMVAYLLLLATLLPTYYFCLLVSGFFINC